MDGDFLENDEDDEADDVGGVAAAAGAKVAVGSTRNSQLRSPRPSDPYKTPLYICSHALVTRFSFQSTLFFQHTSST